MNFLNKKLAIITGGTSGIGLATAAIFLKSGIQVALVGRSLDKGKQAIDILKNHGMYI